MTATATQIQFQELYPKQHAAFFGLERNAYTEATTKAGKSFGALVWLAMHAINESAGSAHVWVSPVYSQARTMFDRLCRMFTRMDPTHSTGWDSNKTDAFVTLPGGGSIWFKGSDKPDTIYGADYAAAVIDEGSRCKEDAFFAVRSTLTATRGPLRVIGNVKGRKNWFYRKCRRAESGESDTSYHKITAQDAVDAGVLEADEIESARRDLPDAVFRELYMAEPSDDGGNPFGLDAIRRCISELPGGDPTGYGWDLAKSVDWSVGIGLDEFGHVSHYSRFQLPWQETMTRIKSETGHVRALIDSTGVGDPIVEGLQRDGAGTIEGFKFTSQSKQQLMEGLAVAIQQGQISYPDGPIVNELEAFEYEYTRTGVKYSAPSGMHDDIVCALALAVMQHVSGPRSMVAEDITVPDWGRGVYDLG